MLSPNGRDTLMGNALTRSVLSSCSARASRCPLDSTSSDSPAPAVTIGTPASVARRANPRRPAKTMRSRSANGLACGCPIFGHAADLG